MGRRRRTHPPASEPGRHSGSARHLRRRALERSGASAPRVVERYRGQIAAIIFEPIICNTCCMEPVPGMIETIRELCDREGMLMIADETITGFRFGSRRRAAASRLRAGPDHPRQGHRRRRAFRRARGQGIGDEKDHRWHGRPCRHAQRQSALPRREQVVSRSRGFASATRTRASSPRSAIS